PSAVLHQIAACVQGPHKAVCTAASKTELLTDLRDREASRLCGQQLEDVERAVRGLDRQSPQLTDIDALTHRAGPKSSYSQNMIVTPPVAKLGTSAIASCISAEPSAFSSAAMSSKYTSDTR